MSQKLPDDIIYKIIEDIEKVSVQRMIREFRYKKTRGHVDRLIKRGINNMSYDIVLILHIHKNMSSFRKETTAYLEKYMDNIREVDLDEKDRLYYLFHNTPFKYNDDDELMKRFLHVLDNEINVLVDVEMWVEQVEKDMAEGRVHKDIIANFLKINSELRPFTMHMFIDYDDDELLTFAVNIYKNTNGTFTVVEDKLFKRIIKASELVELLYRYTPYRITVGADEYTSDELFMYDKKKHYKLYI